MKYSWKIGGEAGFGIITTGLVFAKIASRSGYQIFDYVQYPSLIRGGHNAYEICFADDEVHSLKHNIDCLVCLNEETYLLHKHRLHSSSVIIYDSEEFKPQEAVGTLISVPYRSIITKLKGQTVMKNTIALGASLALLGSDIAILNTLIEEQFEKKGEEVIAYNKQLAQEGYSYVVSNYSSTMQKILVTRERKEQLVLTGNDAFSIGAVISDCRLYAAYPMTPSSSVLATLAAWQDTNKMIIRHAEDEIAVINTAIGSSFAGVRSAVGTSGGGFALMVETVSLAGICEIPLVIFLSQRPGPATGMPTWTEQGDLLFAVHAGHGEFPKIILAPGDQQEMIALTMKAFNLADIYQTPVILMSDMFLSESHKTVSKSAIDSLIAEYKINRGKIVKKTQEAPYLRYRVTDDGISEMLIPGYPGQFYQANSYEHEENSHTSESAKTRIEQVNKRNKKAVTYLKNDFSLPNVYGDVDASDIVFVSWGATKGIILEAQSLLKEKNVNTAFIHFTHVYPLDRDKVTTLFSNKKRYILVENNSTAQFGKLLQQETGIEIQEKILKYDGRPFEVEEIVDKIINLNTKYVNNR